MIFWMLRRESFHSSSWTILAMTAMIMLVVFWPGRLNLDTLGQISQLASGRLTNHAAPLLLALWHPFWDLGLGPGAVFVAQILTFVVGSYLVLRAAFRPIGAACATTFIVFWPPVFGNLASVQRDTWLAALLVLTFGILVRAAQQPWPSRARYLVLAVSAAWLTLASRQNAAPAVAIACVAITGLLGARVRQGRFAASARAPRWIRPLSVVAGGLALTLVMMGTQLGATKLIGVKNVHPETPLYIYDLAALSERERDNLFPDDLLPQRGMKPIDRTYDVDSVLGFLFPAPNTIGPEFSRAVGFPDVSDHAASRLRDYWLDAVTDHPGAYVAGRWTLWLRQIGVARNGLSVYPPDTRHNGGHPFQFPGLYERAMNYLDAFTHPEASFYGQAGGDALFTVWVYLLAAVAAAVVLLRRGRPVPLMLVGALSLSALTYQAGLFLGVWGTRFRYEYPCVVIGTLAAAILLELARRRWRTTDRQRVMRRRRCPDGSAFIASDAGSF